MRSGCRRVGTELWSTSFVVTDGGIHQERGWSLKLSSETCTLLYLIWNHDIVLGRFWSPGMIRNVYPFSLQIHSRNYYHGNKSRSSLSHFWQKFWWIWNLVSKLPKLHIFKIIPRNWTFIGNGIGFLCAEKLHWIESSLLLDLCI